MVAIVVMLTVSTGVILLGFSDRVQQPAPLAALDESVRVTVDDNETQNNLELIHDGGQSIPVENLEVVVDTGSGSATQPVPQTGPLSDGEWSAGEAVSLSLSQSAVCSGGSEVDVSVVVERDESSHVISAESVPVERGQFTLGGGSVTPTVNYTANVTLIGSAITAGGNPVPIDVWVDVGGTETKPWSSISGNGALPQSHVVPNQSAGTNVTVGAQAVGVGLPRRDSDTGGGLVKVLRDGDSAPNTAGFNNQAAASAFIDPYLDSGTVTLADNQAIFLFELGTSNPNAAAADFQDAVVLVSLSANEQAAVVTENAQGEQVLVCPPTGS